MLWRFDIRILRIRLPPVLRWFDIDGFIDLPAMVSVESDMLTS